MKSAQKFLSALPTIVLLALGCSDGAADTGIPIGNTGSSAGTGTAGSGVVGSGGVPGAGGSSAGATTVAGATATAGSSMGGIFNGMAGSGNTGGFNPGGGSAGQGAGGTAAGGSGGGGGSAGAAPTDGKGLYDFNCKSCHGEQGVGGPLAMEIQHPVRDYSLWVVRNGRPLASPYPKAMEKVGTDTLSDAQCNLIWDYLDQPPQPTTGEALFTDYCVNCHGVKGAGGPTMRPLKGEGKNVLTLVRQGKNVGNYSMRRDSMPKFSTTRITDAELNLILAYVNTF